MPLLESEEKDEVLMVGFNAGNQSSLEILFKRYQKPVFNFAWRLLGHRADAEDVTADVFTKLASGKVQYEPRSKFSTWIFTITRNHVLSKLRKQKAFAPLSLFKTQSGETVPRDIADPKPLASDIMNQNETALQVSKAIAKLALNQREAIVLREYHEFTYEEIATTLDCSLANVKVLIFRARETLRVELASVLREDLS